MRGKWGTNEKREEDKIPAAAKPHTTTIPAVKYPLSRKCCGSDVQLAVVQEPLAPATDAGSATRPVTDCNSVHSLLVAL